ncbi:MAG: hypothetical protein FWH47_08140 [Methanomassiliicoccaceae archaeon]|nr:hypothetical protein [Methanomassiliicoccaceae archaeon]
MAEESFFGPWVITTQGEVEMLLRVFEKAEKREPMGSMDVLGMTERGRKTLNGRHFCGI